MVLGRGARRARGRDRARSGVFEATSSNDSQALLRAYGLHLGARLPAAHATSTGRVLLAALDPTALDQWISAQPLPRPTPRTTTDPKQFRALFDAVRRDDHCPASEENKPGVMPLAVPLRNMLGQTVAALNVVSALPGCNARQRDASCRPC